MLITINSELACYFVFLSIETHSKKFNISEENKLRGHMQWAQTHNLIEQVNVSKLTMLWWWTNIRREQQTTHIGFNGSEPKIDCLCNSRCVCVCVCIVLNRKSSVISVNMRRLHVLECVCYPFEQLYCVIASTIVLLVYENKGFKPKVHDAVGILLYSRQSHSLECCCLWNCRSAISCELSAEFRNLWAVNMSFWSKEIVFIEKLSAINTNCLTVITQIQFVFRTANLSWALWSFSV